jgi:hypothetical protein
MPNRDAQSVPQSRIEALRQKHAYLSRRIEEEQRRPSLTFYIHDLKKEKLKVKEALVSLQERAG